jgi:hypothetical protein
MTAFILWIGVSLAVACLAGRFIRSGMVDSTEIDRCNQACDQGRNCVCQKPAQMAP